MSSEPRSSRKKKKRVEIPKSFTNDAMETVTPGCRAGGHGGGAMGHGGHGGGPRGGGGAMGRGGYGGAGPHGGHWGPGWKPGRWGPGWNPSGNLWSPGWGAWPGWQKWALWQPEYYNNYLYDYPVNVSYKCQPQCELDCNTENPGQSPQCSNSCQEYCTRSYSQPPSCNSYCFENCYVPGQSMNTTCNQMCKGDPKCLAVCTYPPAASGFNSCHRACNEACQK